MHTRDPLEPEKIDVSLGYERTDARVSGVLVFLIVLSVIAVIIAGVSYGMGKWINARINKEDGPKSRWAQPVNVRPLGNMASNADMEKAIGASTDNFPMPRVQTDDGNQDVADLHAREDLLLENYSWVDQSQGKIRIPIERAMELMAQRGLPVAAATEQAPLMTGDERPLVLAPLTTGFSRTGYELNEAAAVGNRAR
jgi:hypothetical protein